MSGQKEEFALGVPSDKVPTTTPVVYKGQKYNLIHVDKYITRIDRFKTRIEGSKIFKVRLNGQK